jgi:hypothetical protein
MSDVPPGLHVEQTLDGVRLRVREVHTFRRPTMGKVLLTSLGLGTLPPLAMMLSTAVAKGLGSLEGVLTTLCMGLIFVVPGLLLALMVFAALAWADAARTRVWLTVGQRGIGISGSGLANWSFAPREDLEVTLERKGGAPLLVMTQDGVRHTVHLLVSLDQAEWIADLIRRRVVGAGTADTVPEALHAVRGAKEPPR